MSQEKLAEKTDRSPHNMWLSDNTWAVLEARVYDLRSRVPGLRLSASGLVSDIIEAVLSQSINFDDPLFNRPGITFGPVPMPPDRYPGYLRHLGFVD